MTEHTEQTTIQPSAVPARIQLEDFIEAVTRGVTRALAAQDEVSGYANLAPADRPPFGVLIGLWAPPPTFPNLADLPGSQATLQGR
jgi:hypothetical protein